MKRVFKYFVFATVGALALAGCGTGAEVAETSDESVSKVEQPLKVVTSFTIIEDMVNEVAGERAEVHNLVPTGTDPHEYEPLPDDLRAASDADLLLHNGLNLEGGDAGWFARMVTSVGQSADKVFEVSKEITPLYLGTDSQHETEINPHGFTDPNNGILMVQQVLEALQAVDPGSADYYAERAKIYTEKLVEIEQEYASRIAEVPEAKRVLVTSERAFQYLAKRYGLKEAFLWEIDTEENGSIQQIKELLAFLESSNVSHLVIESNVDPRPMQTVSEESGIPIYENVIYSDEIGGAGAETYIKYLKHNLEVIAGALR